MADILRRYAAVLAIEGADRFKLKAYRRAAGTVEGLHERVATMVGAGRDLTELPGIGKAISQVIAEIVRTGGLAQLEKNWLRCRRSDWNWQRDRRSTQKSWLGFTRS